MRIVLSAWVLLAIAAPSSARAGSNTVELSRIIRNIKEITLAYRKRSTAADGKLFWVQTRPAHDLDDQITVEGKIHCRYPGYRVSGWGSGVITDYKPRNYFRRATTLTGNFTRYVSLPKSVRDQCSMELDRYLRAVRNTPHPRWFEKILRADVTFKLSGECVRTKFPFKGKMDRFSRTFTSKGVRVVCRAMPHVVRKLERRYLYNAYSSSRRDNALVTDGTAAVLKGGGYRGRRKEGILFARPQPGCVALRLYYRGDRRRDFLATVRTPRDRRYKLRAVLGYVLKRKTRAEHVPLKIFWSFARGDYFTTATKQGEQSAKAAGYTYSGTLGYVLPPHWRYMPTY